MIFNGVKWCFLVLGLLLTFVTNGQSPSSNHYYQHKETDGIVHKETLVKEVVVDLGGERSIVLKKMELIHGYLQEDEKRLTGFHVECQERPYLVGVLDLDEAQLLVKLASAPQPNKETQITFNGRYYESVVLEYTSEKFILYLGGWGYRDEKKCPCNWEEFQKITQALKELL